MNYIILFLSCFVITTHFSFAAEQDITPEETSSMFQTLAGPSYKKTHPIDVRYAYANDLWKKYKKELSWFDYFYRMQTHNSKHIKLLSLSLIQENMKIGDLAELLDLINKINRQNRDDICAVTASYLNQFKDVKVHDIKRIFKCCKHMGPIQSKAFLSLAQELTFPDMTGTNASAIAESFKEEYRRYPADIFDLTKQLITPLVHNDDVWTIMENIKRLRVEKRQRVVMIANSLLKSSEKFIKYKHKLTSQILLKMRAMTSEKAATTAKLTKQLIFCHPTVNLLNIFEAASKLEGNEYTIVARAALFGRLGHHSIVAHVLIAPLDERIFGSFTEIDTTTYENPYLHNHSFDKKWFQESVSQIRNHDYLSCLIDNFTQRLIQMSLSADQSSLNVFFQHLFFFRDELEEKEGVSIDPGELVYFVSMVSPGQCDNNIITSHAFVDPKKSILAKLGLLDLFPCDDYLRSFQERDEILQALAYSN